MNSSTVVKIGPKIRPRNRVRVKPRQKPKKLGIEDIYGAGMVALIAGVVQGVTGWLTWRDRRTLRQTLLLIACGLVVILIGLARLAIALMAHH